jgi:glycosyltransferase involved in cell wall biosynthesis
LKIIHSCNRYYPFFGGLETHVQNISEQMVKLGHEVSVYSTDVSGKLPEKEEINGVTVRRFKCFAPNDSYFLSPHLYKSLKAANGDVVHGHDLNGFPLLAGALAKGDRKFFATLHVGAFSSRFRTLARVPYDRLIMHAFLSRADKVICVSDYERVVYQHVLGLPGDKMIVIPNGYDLPPIAFGNSSRNSRTILSVGRLEKSKGFHYLLQSYAELKKDPEFNDVNLVLVGKGPYEIQIRKLITDLNLGKYVTIRQNVSRISLLQLYQQCALFVLLSNYESQGLAVWDAFAFKKPTITSTAAVLGEYVKNGYSVGISLPPNINDLSAKMKLVLKKPDQFKPKEFRMLSWREVSSRLLKLYEMD